MPHHTPLYEWDQRVATAFPDLSPATARVLADWSYGLVLAHTCGLGTVALTLAAVLGQAVHTARQRLREFYPPADRKAGRGRTALDPATCCTPLVRWITAGWADERVAVALDATNLGDRFHVPAAAIVYRGCAIPVAWAVLPAGVTDAWNPHWVRLLDRVSAALGEGWTVLVLTDRGLESAALFRAIVGRGIHPLMRVQARGSFRPDGWRTFYRSARSRPARGAGSRRSERRTGRLPWVARCRAAGWPGCGRVAGPDPGHPVSCADPCWYAVRSWIEKNQADCTSSRGWVGTRRPGYHRRDGVARAGRVVPAMPGRLHRRNRMHDTTQHPAPPRD